MVKNVGGSGLYKFTGMIDPVNDQDYCTKKFHNDNKLAAGDINLADLNEKLHASLTGVGSSDHHVKTVAGEGVDSDSNIIHFNDAEKETNQTSYVKLKEVKVCRALGNLRVRWGFYTNNAADAAKTRLYKNGVAIADEHSTNELSEQTVYDIISGVESGDLLQIYGNCSGISFCYVLNMKIMYSTDYVNNDP